MTLVYLDLGVLWAGVMARVMAASTVAGRVSRVRRWNQVSTVLVAAAGAGAVAITAGAIIGMAVDEMTSHRVVGAVLGVMIAASAWATLGLFGVWARLRHRRGRGRHLPGTMPTAVD